MSNTNIQITTSKSRQWFSNRKYHNNRDTNLSDSDFKNDECINIVEIVNKDVGLKNSSSGDGVVQNINVSAGTYAENLANYYKAFNVPQNLQGLKRGDYTRKLSANNSAIARYETELQHLQTQLEELVLSNGSNDFTDENFKKFEKLNKKYSKKINVTIPNAKAKSEMLQHLRDNTAASVVDNKNKNRKNFVEITFSVTKAPQYLRRDINYGKDVLSVIKEFYKDLGLNMIIHSYSLHLDQSSPHCHLNGSYENTEHSLNSDLENRYGKKFNYHSLQNEFNDFIRSHTLMRKYKHIQELETITRGSKWEYEKNLKKYKDKSKQIEQEVIQDVQSVKDIKNKFFLVEHTREEILEDALIEEMKENRLKSSISSKLEQDNKKIANDMAKIQKSLNNAYIDVKIIERQDKEIKNLTSQMNSYKKKFEDSNLHNDQLRVALAKFDNTDINQKSYDRNR